MMLLITVPFQINSALSLQASRPRIYQQVLLSWIYQQDPEAILGARAGAEGEIKQGKAQGATQRGSWLRPTQFTSQAL